MKTIQMFCEGIYDKDTNSIGIGIGSIFTIDGCHRGFGISY